MTNASHESLGDRMIRAEQWSSSMEQRYRRELASLFQKRFSPTMRWLAGVQAAIWLTFGILGGTIVWWHAPVDEPTWRLFMAIMAAGMLPLGIAFGWAAVNGYFDRRTHGRVMLLAVLFVLGGGLALLNGAWQVQDAVTRGALMLPGVVLILIAGGSLLVDMLEGLHYKTQERLLRMECRLAEIAEIVQRLEKPPR